MTPASSSSSSFNEQVFLNKLSILSGSQESVQSLSNWIIIHKNNHQLICLLWFKKLKEGKNS
jgi:hypothetical protein